MRDREGERPGGLEVGATTRSWSFPPFRLDLDTGSLWRDDALVPLPPKPFVALAALEAHADQVVTDGVLKGCLRQIRRASGERGKTTLVDAFVAQTAATAGGGRHAGAHAARAGRGGGGADGRAPPHPHPGRLALE
jgi:hypothetical protein